MLTAVPAVKDAVDPHAPRGGLPVRGVHRFTVMALDRKTGKVVWEHTPRGAEPHEGAHNDNGTWSSSSPLTDDEHIIAPFESQGSSRRWIATRPTPSPPVYQGIVYFLKTNNGLLTAVEAKTGKAHYQVQRIEGVPNVFASPVAAANKIYIVGREGTTAVIKPGPTYEVLATISLDDHFDASPRWRAERCT